MLIMINFKILIVGKKLALKIKGEIAHQIFFSICITPLFLLATTSKINMLSLLVIFIFIFLFFIHNFLTFSS